MFQVKGRRNPVPIYDFDDFGPIHHYEMHAAQNSGQLNLKFKKIHQKVQNFDNNVKK